MGKMTFRLPLILGVVLLWGAVPLPGVEFYLDCAGGDDTARGDHPEAAWRSLERVNLATFLPGDSILLRRGTTCSGALQPLGSGSEGRPIVMGAYGTGPRPIIDAGEREAAIKLFNQHHWHILSLETTGGNPFGIYVTGDVAGGLRHFRIIDVLVHDVGGTVSNKESGLIVVAPGSIDTTFHDVVIDGVTAHSTTQWMGILVGGDDFGGTPSSPRSTDVTIRNSTVHHVYGDGIALYQVNRGLIESNVAYETGNNPVQTVGTPNGIWTWMCGDCVVQFNEGYRTGSPGVDGGVFDIDYGCSNNIVQYNYGHDAAGYCVAVFGALGSTSDSVVRYNVCSNNGRDPSKAGQGDIYVFTWAGGTLDGVQIYNNTIYWNPAAEAPAFNVRGETLPGDGPRMFKNNIIYSTVESLVRLPVDSGFDLDHNIFWSEASPGPRWRVGDETVSNLVAWQRLGNDAASRYDDPLLTDPTHHGEAPVAAFAPRADSPAVDGGIDVGDTDLRDFRGEPVPFGSSCDIGALEWRPENQCANGRDDDGDDLIDCADPDCGLVSRCLPSSSSRRPFRPNWR